MAMSEEIPLDDVELKPSSFSVKHELLPDSVIITNGNWKQQKTIMTRIFEQGKNAFSQQRSYFKLEEDESESDDPIRETVSFLNSLECI